MDLTTRNSLPLVLISWQTAAPTSTFAITFSVVCHVAYVTYFPSDDIVRRVALICNNAFEGGGWALVRRVKQGKVWYQSKDKLKMTDQYGVTASKPTAESSLSIAVPSWITTGTVFLFATGV